MGNWLIEPIDPLIVRDGRPFGPTPGARARTLTFPYPQTIAGAVRTREGLKGDGRFDEKRAHEVTKLSIRGPLLVELGTDGEPSCFLFPAPSDALLLKEKDGEGIMRRVLEPMNAPEGTLTDLPGHLALIGMRGEATQEKPAKHPPTFWYWKEMQAWLTDPQADPNPISRADLGILRLPEDARMHVGIKPQTQTADEESGALFMTAGLAFQTIPFPSIKVAFPALSAAKQYALFVETDAASIKPGLAPLGGERRTMQWRPATCALPGCPQEIEDYIAKTGACRIVLATAAYFEDVARPAYLSQPHEGVTATVKAIAVSRSETVSGWDFAKKREENGRTIFGEPKPSRRLAPAGTVLWLTLDGDEAQRRAWTKALWLQSISDDYPDADAVRDAGQYRRDGYGLALLGTWNGTIKPWGNEP